MEELRCRRNKVSDRDSLLGNHLINIPFAAAGAVRPEMGEAANNSSSKQILITLNEFDVKHEYYYTTFARQTLTDSDGNPL